MSRLSFRPRPLDIHKKLPIVKSIKDFEDDEAYINSATTRNSHWFRHAAEGDSEVHQNSSKKSISEIPTPQFNVVDTYERDYSCTFKQPTSYLRVRGGRTEIGELVDYDLDNEDEDWLQEFNNEKRVLGPEKFETILFKLEVLDHKARERAGIIAPTFGAPVSVILELDAAAEVLKFHSVGFAVFQSVYNYWKAKRQHWQKPILRRLQPPPPVSDTNPYNVFRPREKAHRLHTRRMQRRENNVQSFEKLRQVRRNLGQAETMLKSLIKREEKKRELMESEVRLQRIQVKYKHEAQLVEDGLAGFPSNSGRFESSDDDYIDSDEASNGRPRAQSARMQHSPYMDSKLLVIPTGRMKRELKSRPRPHGWSRTKDPHEPLLLFTRPLDPERLAATGIRSPPDPPIENGSVAPPYRFHGRIGRGGRIIFDRWNPLLEAPESPPRAPSNRLPPQPNG